MVRFELTFSAEGSSGTSAAAHSVAPVGRIVRDSSRVIPETACSGP
jgi:hypothetical protein